MRATLRWLVIGLGVVVSLGGMSAWAHPTEDSPLVSLPTGTVLTFKRNVNILPRTSNTHLGGGIYLFVAPSDKDRLVKQDTKCTVTSVSEGRLAGEELIAINVTCMTEKNTKLVIGDYSNNTSISSLNAAFEKTFPDPEIIEE